MWICLLPEIPAGCRDTREAHLQWYRSYQNSSVRGVWGVLHDSHQLSCAENEATWCGTKEQNEGRASVPASSRCHGNNFVLHKEADVVTVSKAGAQDVSTATVQLYCGPCMTHVSMASHFVFLATNLSYQSNSWQKWKVRLYLQPE